MMSVGVMECTGYNVGQSIIRAVVLSGREENREISDKTPEILHFREKKL